MNSIRLVSPSEATVTVGAIPPLLFTDMNSLYAHRAGRLREIAKGHPLEGYLLFVATIVDAQYNANSQYSLPTNIKETLNTITETNQPLLSIKNHQTDPHWQQLLTSIITTLKPNASATITELLESLEKSNAAERDTLAQHLLNGEFNKVGSGKALFLWAALSVYWSQLANQLPHTARTEVGELRHHCPICGCSPVASVVQIGSDSGLRYLHCSLCETKWHMVRVKCSNCEQSGNLIYCSLDSEHAYVKAESCNDCQSYLKIFYQEKDPKLDPVADDLATLTLDAKMEEEENIARSGINPYLFPAS